MARKSRSTAIDSKMSLPDWPAFISERESQDRTRKLLLGVLALSIAFFIATQVML